MSLESNSAKIAQLKAKIESLPKAPAGSITITSNGTYDVKEKASAIVNVAGSTSGGSAIAGITELETVSFTCEQTATGNGEEVYNYVGGYFTLPDDYFTTCKYKIIFPFKTNITNESEYTYDTVGLIVIDNYAAGESGSIDYHGLIELGQDNIQIFGPNIGEPTAEIPAVVDIFTNTDGTKYGIDLYVLSTAFTTTTGIQDSFGSYTYYIPQNCLENIHPLLISYDELNSGGGQQLTDSNIIVDPNNKNSIQYQQMNDVVAEYLKNVSYDISDYTTTQVNTYLAKTTSYSKEEPFGLNVNVPANSTITIEQNGKTRTEIASGTHTIYNLEPLKTASITVGGKTYKVVPESGVRMIYAPSVYNVRDLGGWSCDGGRVKYGKLFRGSEFTGTNTNDITAADIDCIKNWCGVKVDLDLRFAGEANNETASPLGSDVEYSRISINAYAQAFTNTPANLALAVKKCIDSVNDNKPVYFHCKSGADRTGTISFILLSLLGVSPSDKDKEYELTAFTDEKDGARFRNTNYTLTDGNSWYALLSQFRNNYSGMNDCEKVVAWAVANGISADSINLFRTNMISGYVSEVDVPAQTYTVTSSLTNCSSNNTTTVVSEEDSYTAIISANSGYTLDGATISIKMSGVDITGSVYNNGVITINAITGNIVITITAAEFIPTYTNILNTALTPNTKAEVWNGVGFKNGAYASSASPFYGTDSACFCIGAIPYNAGDVFYVKGATLEGANHERIGALNATNGCVFCKTFNFATAETTITKLGDKYYKIQFNSSYSNYAAIKYMIFSAQGMANDIIITRNEEITGGVEPSLITTYGIAADMRLSTATGALKAQSGYAVIGSTKSIHLTAGQTLTVKNGQLPSTTDNYSAIAVFENDTNDADDLVTSGYLYNGTRFNGLDFTNQGNTDMTISASASTNIYFKISFPCTNISQVELLLN